MSDLAPPGAPQELDLAHREGREVVVQHEALLRLALEPIEALDILGRPERACHESLSLAAREQSGAVRAGEDSDLTGDAADLVRLSPIEAAALDEQLPPGDRLVEIVKDRRGLLAARRLVLGDRLELFLEEGADGAVGVDLHRDLHGLIQPIRAGPLDGRIERRIELPHFYLALRLPDLEANLLLKP